MADPQPQLTSDQAFDFQEEFLERKKQNTFQERRKEGRTKNSRSSYAVYVIGGFSVFFNFISIAFPYWRSSWVAVIGYGHRRHWGLFVVQGRFSRPHHLVSDIACKHFGETMLGSTCTSPLCRWYRLKCHTYYNFMLASYICAFFYIVAQILFLLVFRWMIKLEPRSIRYANLWVKVAVFFQLGSVVAWFIFSELMFQELEEMAFYPKPAPGVSFILAVLSCIGWIVNTILIRILCGMWPEVDPDDPDQFKDDDDDDDDDDEDEDASSGERQWYYQDTSGEVQGPFKSSKMIGWIEASQLPADTPVRAADGSDFTPIGDGSLIKGAPTKNVSAIAGAAAAPSAVERTWFYHDKDGAIQGPFPTSQMQQWIQEGHFAPDTLVRGFDEADFSPLGDGSRVR